MQTISVPFCSDTDMKIFSGVLSAGATGTVAGMLYFSGMTPAAGIPHSMRTLIAVFGDAAPDEKRLELLDCPETVAVVCLGSPPQKALLQLLQSRINRPLPILLLPTLPGALHGKIAILESAAATLYVSPDLKILTRYRRTRFYGNPTVGKSDIPVFPVLCENMPVVSGAGGLLADFAGYLNAPGKTPDNALREEEYFERYRTLAEECYGRPITVLLSADRPEGAVRSELRGLYRAAVYGDFSLLCAGLHTAGEIHACPEFLSRIFCDLRSEGHEVNGSLPRGILLDSPLILTTDRLPAGIDWVCTDTGRLISLLCGTASGTPNSDGAEEEALRVIASAPLLAGARLRAVCRRERLSEAEQRFYEAARAEVLYAIPTGRKIL